jgi:para-nitrobenzyl esterase
MLFAFKAVIGFISILLLLAPGSSSQTATPTSTVKVTTEHGNFTGAADSSLDSFYDIPYAQPPVGKLRLQPPQPILQDFGCLDVSKKTSSHCYGIRADPAASEILPAFVLQDGTEDCLKLDIIRPHTLSEGVLLPVFVFIHGYAIHHL